MALEKRNVEAALESKKERVVELESIIADLQTKTQTSSTSVATENLSSIGETSQTSIHSTPNPAELALSAELDSLRKRVNEMVCLLLLFNTIQQGFSFRILPFLCQAADNDQLAKLALEKESRIQELEIRIDRIQSELHVATSNHDTVQSEKLLQVLPFHIVVHDSLLITLDHKHYRQCRATKWPHREQSLKIDSSRSKWKNWKRLLSSW